MPILPIDLAEAGLYYNGLTDECYCFYCGVAIFNWEATDIPLNVSIKSLISNPDFVSINYE
jgi:hypothetical protein